MIVQLRCYPLSDTWVNSVSGLNGRRKCRKGEEEVWKDTGDLFQMGITGSWLPKCVRPLWFREVLRGRL